jgi:hypothetical protein
MPQADLCDVVHRLYFNAELTFAMDIIIAARYKAPLLTATVHSISVSACKFIDEGTQALVKAGGDPTTFDESTFKSHWFESVEQYSLIVHGDISVIRMTHSQEAANNYC